VVSLAFEVCRLALLSRSTASLGAGVENSGTGLSVMSGVSGWQGVSGPNSTRSRTSVLGLDFLHADSSPMATQSTSEGTPVWNQFAEDHGYSSASDTISFRTAFK
jgi:hypothetical protein